MGLVIKNKINNLLNYPGGKVRAVKQICKYIPKNTTKLCSPFFGGGSIELACANAGIEIYGYDIFGPLVNFWQCVIFNSNKLADIVEEYYPLKKVDFYKLQKEYNKYTSKYERAAIFYVLNRSSFAGLTFSGGMVTGHPRFTKSSIDRLRQFKVNNISIKKLDFVKSIGLHHDVLLYLDPPYLIKSFLYGNKGDTHKDFKHYELASILKNRDNWILSYNNCKEIVNIYKDYTILYPKWTYGMSNDKNSKEVLILSKDISEYHSKSINYELLKSK